MAGRASDGAGLAWPIRTSLLLLPISQKSHHCSLVLTIMSVRLMCSAKHKKRFVWYMGRFTDLIFLKAHHLLQAESIASYSSSSRLFMRSPQARPCSARFQFCSVSDRTETWILKSPACNESVGMPRGQFYVIVHRLDTKRKLLQPTFGENRSPSILRHAKG